MAVEGSLYLETDQYVVVALISNQIYMYEGNTSEVAEGYFDVINFDTVTQSPYSYNRSIINYNRKNADSIAAIAKEKYGVDARPLAIALVQVD